MVAPVPPLASGKAPVTLVVKSTAPAASLVAVIFPAAIVGAAAVLAGSKSPANCIFPFTVEVASGEPSLAFQTGVVVVPTLVSICLVVVL